MAHFIRDEIACQRAVGLSQRYSIPQLGIIVLSSASYHNLPSRNRFPSLHSPPNRSSRGLIRPAISRVTQGEDVELAICSSRTRQRSRSALQSCPLGEDGPASSVCQELLCPISSTPFPLVLATCHKNLFHSLNSFHSPVPP
jgi:hypothetical protein